MRAVFELDFKGTIWSGSDDLVSDNALPKCQRAGHTAVGGGRDADSASDFFKRLGRRRAEDRKRRAQQRRDDKLGVHLAYPLVQPPRGLTRFMTAQEPKLSPMAAARA